MIKTIIYENFDTFFEKEVYSLRNKGFIFRGHSSIKYELTPTALRKGNVSKLFKLMEYPCDDEFQQYQFNQISAEYELLDKFFEKAKKQGLKVPIISAINDDYRIGALNYMNIVTADKPYPWLMKNLSELAALAQHYGTFTRLLDWTQDIFVSLYFSVTDAIQRYINSLEEERDKEERDKEEWDKEEWDKEEWDKEKLVIWALNSAYIQRKLNYIPLKFVVPPYSDNPNLNAQKGVLTYWEILVKNDQHEENATLTKTDSKSLDKLLEEYFNNHPIKIDGDEEPIEILRKFELPFIECVKIYFKLGQFGYTATRLFPGYDGVTKEIKEDQNARIMQQVIKKSQIARSLQQAINEISNLTK